MCRAAIIDKSNASAGPQKSSATKALFGFGTTLLLGAVATYILSSISRFDASSGYVTSVPTCVPPDGLALLKVYGNEPISYLHPIEASHEVSLLFSQGMLHLFGYNQPEAYRNFAAAAKIDPNCAMCYFGIALSYGANINSPITEEKYTRGKEALDKAEALASNASLSSLHSDLIKAQRIRFPFSSNDWVSQGGTALEAAYAEAMREVYLNHSDSDDAASLFAEALMNTSPWSYHTSSSNSLIKRTALAEEVYDVLKGVLARNPEHPLALHLFIHLIENGPNPSEAEAAADMLARNIRSNGHNGHLMHMPAHIYYKVGRYDDCVSYSAAAIAKDQHYLDNCLSPYFPAHSKAVLVECAIFAADSSTAHIFSGTLRNMHEFYMANPGTAYPTPQEFIHLRFGQWTDLEDLLKEEEKYFENEIKSLPPYFAAMRYFSKILLLLASNQLPDAKETLLHLEDEVAAIPVPAMPKTHPFYPNTIEMGHIMINIASAAIAVQEGSLDDAAAMLREAVEIEDAFALVEPETFYMPVRQCLSGVLLRKAHETQSSSALTEAVEALRYDLKMHPNNVFSLSGLSVAASVGLSDEETRLIEQSRDVLMAGPCCELNMC